jgi:hypothetical protein
MEVEDSSDFTCWSTLGVVPVLDPMKGPEQRFYRVRVVEP